MKYLNLNLNTELPIRILLNVLLITIELIGDEIPSAHSIAWKLRLVLDNGIHGLIAAFSWLIITDCQYELISRNLIEVLLCGCLGALIDLDHFIEARSFYIKVNIRSLLI